MTVIDPDFYAKISIAEGDAPFLTAKVTDKAGTIITQATVSTIEATIINAVSGVTVLNESALTEGTVWFDTYQTLTNQDGDLLTYNFGWQTLSSYFATTTFADDGQFKVEVWVTPVSGEQFRAGWWLVTVKKSIVPLA